MRGLLWMLLVFCLCGCQHGRPPFYPLGIYTAGSTNGLAVIRAAGFNAVTGPATPSFLDTAQRLGLRVLAPPGTSAGPNFDADTARSTVKAFDPHPALWAWYLVDEPDLNLVPPGEVRQAQRFLKSLPAHKPTALVIYQGYRALDYANLADITMIDRYPIPWLPLANFGQHVRLVRLALGRKKPLIAVLQAFDWASHPDLMPGEKNLRPPTYDELRCMAYCALAERATGLFFFTFADAQWQILDHPETWNAVQNVVGEVRDNLPLFQAQHLWWPKKESWLDRSKQFNAALEASITTVLLRVRHGNRRVPAGDYILAVNNTAWRQAYSFVPPFKRASSLSVLGESRSLTSKEGWVTDDFGPYGVHVYGQLW